MGRKELVVLDKQKRALNLPGSPGDCDEVTVWAAWVCLHATLGKVSEF